MDMQAMHKSFNQQVAMNLRCVMELRQISLEKLAEATGLHASTIQRIIDPDHPRQPRLSVFLRVCQALKITPNEALGLFPIAPFDIELASPHLTALTPKKQSKKAKNPKPKKYPNYENIVETEHCEVW